MSIVMFNRELIGRIPSSPAFLLDETRVLSNLAPLRSLKQASGCKVLYAMKALPLSTLLEFIQPHMDGFAVSSLFEAKLAQQITGSSEIHLTTPGLRPEEFTELGRLCSHISFNSLSQLQRLHKPGSAYSPGLRINPKRSFLADSRFDPCGPHSKLGVDINELRSHWPAGMQGLHLHTLFAAQSFQPLVETIDSLLPLLKRLGRLTWLNLGGGYLYHSIAEQGELIKLIRHLLDKYVGQVLIEPGKAVVGNAGYLLCTVLDRFVSDGKPVLILDTSVNHHPEVFEYQRKPALYGGEPEQGESALLAGSTCLAGDVFGAYRFAVLPEVGDRLLFSDVGAYSLIKANRFNGYNLPDIYRIQAGQAYLVKQYSYVDFQRQWLA
ncbi:MAG: carboxynorspermidine decarboxylase [Methylomonas sp.]|jgi:carboxynorspermidine decarboxylase